MTRDFIVWRCLHGGPLTPDTIMNPEPHPRVPWTELCARNIPLLEKLTDTYGACAILARDGERIVGQLRFYPKALQGMAGTEELEFCMQQVYPHGPQDDFVERAFPARADLSEKTLLVHCLMTGSPSQKENPYLRKGVGTRLVRFLTDWARAQGWQAIEAKTHEDIPLLYAMSGSAGRTFWEKLGFHVAKTETVQSFLEDTPFSKALRASAEQAGIDPALVPNTYTMRFEL